MGGSEARKVGFSMMMLRYPGVMVFYRYTMFWRVGRSGLLGVPAWFGGCHPISPLLTKKNSDSGQILQIFLGTVQSTGYPDGGIICAYLSLGHHHWTEDLELDAKL